MVVIEPLDDECREDSVTTGPAGRSKRNSSLTESQDDANGNRKSSDKKTPQVVDDEDDLQITSCGIGSWRPEWMQVLANTKLFLINICLIGVVQSMAGSVQFTVMNTLEKRFAFDSKISALINIADNISVMLLSPIVGYYAVRFNRSKLIGTGQLIIATSCLISASPYFIYGPAKHFVERTARPSALSLFLNVTSTSSAATSSSSATFSGVGVCDTSEGAGEHCDQHSRGSTVWPAVFLFALGQLVRGIGNSVYYIVAMPFMDDNVPKKSSPMYIAIMQTVMLIGPGLGLVLFSFCLKLNEDPWFDPGFDRADPRFIGAYWLCYLVVVVLILLIASPVFLFPGRFKGATVKGETISKQLTASGGARQALRRFLSNPLILLFVLGNATRYSGIIGFYMFYLKYLETTYRISAAATSRYLGVASLLPMAIGMLCGGCILTRFKPKAKAFFIFIFLVEFVSVFTLGSGLFLSCDPIRLRGQSVEDTGAGIYALNESCNADCHCTTRVFSPLCDRSTGTTYFSPCHAGCTSSFNSTLSSDGVASTIYQNCSCLASSLPPLINSSTRGNQSSLSQSSVSSFLAEAISGYCPADVDRCFPTLIKFIAIMVAGNMIAQTSTTGNFLINYRAVEPMDKSFVSGIIGTLISLLSFIPVPLLYGHIADSSCLVWERKCGKQGNCWVYDNDRFRNVLFGTTIIFLSLGSFFDFLMIFFSHRLKNIYDDEDDKTETNGELNSNIVVEKTADDFAMDIVKNEKQ